MATCGYIKVQPNGLKEKSAKSTQKWDPVSKRMVSIPPRNVISNLLLSRVGESSTINVTWNKTSPIRTATLQFYRTDDTTNVTFALGGPIYIYDNMQSYSGEIDFQFDNTYFCTLSEPCSDMITSNSIVVVNLIPVVTITNYIPITGNNPNYLGDYWFTYSPGNVEITWTCNPPSEVTVQLFGVPIDFNYVGGDLVADLSGEYIVRETFTTTSTSQVINFSPYVPWIIGEEFYRPGGRFAIVITPTNGGVAVEGGGVTAFFY
jgi:hypothetical protein